MDTEGIIVIALIVAICIAIYFRITTPKNTVKEQPGSNPNLKICRHCGNEVAKTAVTCPKCGGNVESAEVLQYKVLLQIISVILIAISLYYLFK